MLIRRRDWARAATEARIWPLLAVAPPTNTHTQSEASVSSPPGIAVEASVDGPEPGYVATPIFVAEAALTLAAERAQLLRNAGGGGVCTPGTALYPSGYMDRLRSRGITFALLPSVAVGADDRKQQ